MTCGQSHGPARSRARRRLTDPDFPDLRIEADWIAFALHGQVVMVPEAGHYPQSQQPGITTGAIQRFLESVPSRA
jgi:pimeloyl-ACP methyl ester carboxylesterase